MLLRIRSLVGPVLLAAFVLGHAHAYFGSAAGRLQPPEDADDGKNCFCELKGSINDCSCTVDTVDYFNNNKVYPRLRSLLLKDYFRFYRVNLHKQCPFWEDDSKCAMRFCSVSPCADKDIPRGLRDLHEDGGMDALDAAAGGAAAPYAKYLADDDEPGASVAAAGGGCHKDLNVELSYLNTSISKTAAKGFERWADHDEQADNFCILDDHQDGAEYVDLLLNPERYTGYRGDSAHRIWRTIYQENCFGGGVTGVTSVQQPFMAQSAYSALCMEQRAFYRLLSGMHTSINIHLSAIYLQSDPSDFVTPSGVWGRNLAEFKRRFSAETTHGAGLHWLQNLYFVYLVEMRALAKAAAYLRNEKYYTGVPDEDAEVLTAVTDLLNVIETFPTHFNESAMFSGGGFESLQLKSVFRDKFRNISKIMDCVGCDKCRLWGKLQVQGLGTALKILFSGKFEVQISQIDPDPHFRLRRSEIVSLFNAFGRLSNSINELEEFRKVIR